jgi:hypothetical protein
VASSSAEEHSDHLRQVFRLLAANGLVFNTRKSLFGQKELHYLGHLISAGITPPPSRVEAIANVPVRTSKVELQHFLGMVNLYQRFMPLLAAKLNPLHEATACKGPSVTWTADCNVAFEEGCPQVVPRVPCLPVLQGPPACSKAPSSLAAAGPARRPVLLARGP